MTQVKWAVVVVQLEEGSLAKPDIRSLNPNFWQNFNCKLYINME